LEARGGKTIGQIQVEQGNANTYLMQRLALHKDFTHPPVRLGCLTVRIV